MSPGPVPALRARGVSLRFGGVQALLDVDIDVPAGAVTGLIGPNGAGKTTLFDVLCGLQRPDAGTVAIGGRDVTRMGPDHRARLGLARTFQRLELFWSLSAADNVRVGAEATVQWWRWSHRRRAGARAAAAPGTEVVGALLERVGLGAVGDVPVDTLTTDRARLVELARALAIGPRVLLLDEPGSGLDGPESAALGELLVELARQGMAVLLVEHDMELVMRVCDRLHVLDAGQVIASGTPDEIRGHQAVRDAYLGAATAHAGAPQTGAPQTGASQTGERPGEPS
ncbi:MAG TPA: ABC transporter ATP-binding protein [Acidimicrobiales bacterium]|nr:ABC transporter ATP-binding protein [Acidimicrobiales bacterium]